MHRLVDLIALLVVAWYVVRGGRRGLLLSLLQVAGILAAYLGTYHLGLRLGRLLYGRFELSPLYAMVGGSLAVFVLILLVFGLVERRIRKAQDRKREETGRSGVALDSRVAGACFGFITGGLLVVLIAWCYQLMRATPALQTLPDISASVAARASRQVVYQAALAALESKLEDDDQAEKLAHMISAPAEAVAKLRDLADEPLLQALLRSEAFREDVLSGEKARVVRNKDLRRLLYDKPAMERMQEAGLLPSGPIDSDFKEGLCEQLALAGSRIKPVLEDPEVQTLVQEMRDEGLLDDPDLRKLITDARVWRITERVLQRKIEEEPSA
jgi:uncharacterized membrane protein required for colicin V production